ncbi:MAG: MASE3 domain-containing protein [Methanococcaceae archaeon]
MNQSLEFIEKNIIKVLSLAVLIGLFLMHQYSYLLFHTTVELITIGIAWAVFMVTWNSHDISKDNRITFIGIAYLFISIVDLFHTIVYSGMNILHGYNSDLPTQLWISARYINSISFLVLAIISHRKYYFSLIFLAYSLIIALVFSCIFIWNIFPVCYIEGIGLTTFKKVSEYIICLILLSSIILLKRGNKFDKNVLNILTASIILLIVSEFAFSFYLTVRDQSNLIGHLLKLFSSYLLYKALIETGMRKPFLLLFRNLKESESNLIDLNKRLETELDRRQAAEIKLRSIVGELEHSNKELEQFAYVASHDLQEPLRMISNFTQLLGKKYKDKLDDNANEYIEFIVDGSKRMQKLISGLLSYARISSHNAPFVPTDLNNIIQDVLRDLQLVIAESGTDVTCAKLPTINADPVQIKQIFQNLISNAIKFKNHIKPQVQINAELNAGKWIFSVKDNGIGISPEYFERIFVIFQRLHERKSYPGTGLGLAICKKIVERHGGIIWVESETGKGTTFYFSIPE